MIRTTQHIHKLTLTLLTLCFLFTQNIWADGNPHIESLTGSISGNTLTLIAKMNYDNIENQISESVQYHWTKGGVAQSGNNYIFTDNNAFTPTDITWQVYATYTYDGEEKWTETVTYIQKHPDVSLTGAVDGFVLTLTPTLNTCGVSVTNVQYYLLNEVSDTESGTAFVATQDAINFEGKTWVVYATYVYDGNNYRSSCGTYIQEPSAMPILSVDKNEEHDQSHDQLVMTATLNHEYGTKITNIQYHWSKNGGAEESEHGNTITSPHSFSTQEWSCYASFEYDGKTYNTNTETYTYYSTLGHVMVHIDDTVDGKYKAVLYKADEHGESTGVLVELPSTVTVSYNWKTNLNPSGSYGTTQEVAKPTDPNVVWIECKVTLTDNNSESIVKYRVKLINNDAQCVVFLDPTNGNDNYSGFDKTNPVKTWAAAYKRLPPGGTWDNNIIVVSGNLSLLITEKETNGIAATITGVWPWTSENTTAEKVKNGGKVTLASTVSGTSQGSRIGSDTKFKYLRFDGSSGYPAFSLYLHDATFDVGCWMNDISGLLSTNNGAYSGRLAPNMQVFIFADTYNFTTNTTDGGWSDLMKKPVNLTIKSGKFGRILSNRVTGTTDAQIKQRYVIGNPSKPLMCVVNVDIDPETNTGDWNPKNYPDDIAFLCAGMTQGTEYADVTFNIKRGKIATLVGAMQGNSIANTPKVGISNSSFFGRTVVNINPDNDADVTIQRYYATCFGRYTDGQNGTSNAAFYGHSILNMTGGTIESGAYVSAGGICGLQSPDGKYHTNDQFIPYLDNTTSYSKYPYMGIKYQAYDAGKNIAKVTTTLNGNTETIDLAETVTEMNISGGTVKDGVYGGGYGFSPEMPAARAMAGAGSLWGNTNVNISGGNIEGGIYGGGAGDINYYKTDKEKFKTVASVYGNTNVTITGTPNIEGNIYGGGAGVMATSPTEEFLEIARVYGNTNILFNADYTDDNPFRGNIYGGGAHGGVEGNTNVQIKKGVIIGNVFGGSQGQEGYSNKAKVVGTTKVVIGEEDK